LDTARRNLRDAMVVSWYLTQSDVSAAKRVCERAVKEYGLQKAIYADYAFLIALVDRDGDRALNVLKGVPPSQQQSFQYFRAQALIFAVKGDHQTARAAVVKAKDAARKSKMRPDADDDAILTAIENDQPLPTLQRAEAA